MHTREYSKRLGPLSAEQFQIALDRFQLGTLVRAELIPFGLFGQNVFLTTTAGEFVLRGCPHFAWQFPTEQYFVQLLHEQTPVPVPWPYLHDASTDIFGWSYVLMPRLRGLQIADPEVVKQLHPQDRIGIARAMGETLAQLHVLTGAQVGRYDPLTGAIHPFELQEELAWPFPPKDPPASAVTVSHAERIIAVIRHTIARSRGYNEQTTADDADWAEELLASAAPALADTFQPGFVMVDYKEANVVAQERRDGWHISGVFDLMEAHFGDCEIDLSRQTAAYLDEDPQLASVFVRAYLQHRPPRPGFAKRFPIYMLLDRLIIWSYSQRLGRGPGGSTLSLRAWASPYTSCLSRLLE